MEQYSRWPVGPDEVRAQRLEGRLTALGQRLFDSLFAGADQSRCWQQFRDAQGGGRKLLTLDTTDPDALRLPWELLADERSHLFALGVSIRRKAHETHQAIAPGFALPVRILVLSPRPEGTGFIDPFASPTALLDGVAPLGPAQVQVEVLAEPTFAALSRRLRDPRAPPVHVIHFDGHGVYDERSGQGQLAFEDGRGALDRVDVDRLGALMSASRTPLMVLDACESARADGADPFRSVAPRLIDTGAGSVLAMPYSVLVKTSEVYFRGFYQALARGDSIGQAADQGRWGLLDNPERYRIHHPDKGEIRVRLKDWFLPVLYQRGPDPIPFDPQRAPAAGQVAQPAGDPAAARLLGAFPPPPEVFIGRNRERWVLERRLRDQPLVLLHGLPGQGKTELAAETARWLVRTGRFQRALFLSFRDGGDRDSAILAMGQALLGAEFAALPRAQQPERLTQALAAAPTLILWDHLDALLPGAPQALPPAELRRLLDLGASLTAAGGANAPRLILTSDSPDLDHPDYARPQRRMGLGGLATGEALDLAARLLDAQGLPRPDRDALTRLIEHLGGHLLAIRLVVPQLHRHGNDPDRVIARFAGLVPGLADPGRPAGERGLAAGIAFALERIEADHGALLRRLAPFQGGAFNAWLAVAGGFEDEAEIKTLYQTLIPALQGAGLLTAEPLDLSEGAIAFLFGEEPAASLYTERRQFDYYRFHPALGPWLQHRAQPAGEAQPETNPDPDPLEHWRRAYHALANRLYLLDSRDPGSARALARAELGNLVRALDLTLAAGDPDAADFADSLVRFLNLSGRWREAENLLARDEVLDPAPTGPVSRQEFLSTSNAGEQLIRQGRPAAAAALFRGLLTRMDLGMANQGLTAGYDRATTQHRLGRSLADQGLAQAAEVAYKAALATLAGLDQEHRSVRRATGVVHTDLADILTAQGRYGEAKTEYEAGLAVDLASGDRRGAAVSNGQLGALALRQRDYAEARRRYREALETFRGLGEPESEAVAQHQLGVVAQGQAMGAQGPERRALLAEADQRYRESYRLEEGYGNRAGAAQTANQLANVARLAGRHEDAELWYRRALDHFEAVDERRSMSFVGSNWASLLKNLALLPEADRPPAFRGRDLLAEAETLAGRAAEIKEALDDPSTEPWKTYAILADIAGARADQAEAAGQPGEPHRTAPGPRTTAAGSGSPSPPSPATGSCCATPGRNWRTPLPRRRTRRYLPRSNRS